MELSKFTIQLQEIQAGINKLARSPVRKRASHSETEAMLKILESVGKKIQPLELNEITGQLSKELISDTEKLVRFLLLVAFLDQHAESPTAKSTAIKIHEVFGDDLFFKPKETLTRLEKLVRLKEWLQDLSRYRKSPAEIRFVCAESWGIFNL